MEDKCLLSAKRDELLKKMHLFLTVPFLFTPPILLKRMTKDIFHAHSPLCPLTSHHLFFAYHSSSCFSSPVLRPSSHSILCPFILSPSLCIHLPVSSVGGHTNYSSFSPLLSLMLVSTFPHSLSTTDTWLNSAGHLSVHPSLLFSFCLFFHPVYPSYLLLYSLLLKMENIYSFFSSFPEELFFFFYTFLPSFTLSPHAS